MVAGVAAGSQVGVISMTALRYAQPGAGDLVMPIRPAQLINANFRHIQVQPDSRLQNGVPLYKLRILDVLIDHLSPRSAAGSLTGSVTSGSPAPGSPAPGSLTSGTLRSGSFPRGSVDASSIDSVIMEMSKELRNTYRAGFLPAPGAFVDLVA